ncbi:MAG: hypothetical protein Q7Q73_04205 [Verrucomicrobiota bacterium JB024]|nr:hypothetical protein [Verrucomicrobiota bacterium JB024]
MKALNLEISLKPFYGLDRAATAELCLHIIEDWKLLIRHAEELSFLLWASDGSEILEYDGQLDSPMEWARYIGNANPHPDFNLPGDPERKSLHTSRNLYRPGAELLTYRRLAEIVECLREAIASTGLKPRIGLAFDPGGEFAPSEFKFKRHREICLAHTMGSASFVCCYGVLDGDKRAYAGFPEGIPSGTSLGTFLGRQFQCLAQDIGLDYIWFSNGFGFGMETWMSEGPLFDGEHFYPEQAPATRDRILGFWRDFRRECPELGIETRGTNLGTGTDLASDATPLRELYAGGFDFAPPPNSPWASINSDFGIEIAGYLSRIVEGPAGKPIPFRFYIHDPWWLNSPWLDRYERQPHDIYMPMATARIDDQGRAHAPDTLNLLTLDDSYGEMPEAVPAESTPHLQRAWRERADAAGPIVWLYPFDELHDAMFEEPRRPERLFHNDWFVREIINAGVPVNTVISTRAFNALDGDTRSAIAGRILLSPAPYNDEADRRLIDWIEAGGDAIVYGPLTDAPRLREKLRLSTASPLHGEMQISLDAPLPELDNLGQPGEECLRYEHRPLMSAGALKEIAADDADLGMSAHQGDQSRALAASYTSAAGGRLKWLRAPLPMTLAKGGHLPYPDEPGTVFAFAKAVRRLLAEFGWQIGFGGESFTQSNSTLLVNRHVTQRNSLLTVHRHDNGWFFSGCTPDETVGLSLRTPWGAPLLLGKETQLHDGSSTYRQPRGWRNECRVFVDQPEGWLKHIEHLPGQIGVARRMFVHGLKDATVRFFPPAGCGPVSLWMNPLHPYITGEDEPLHRIDSPSGLILETKRKVTGTLLISIAKP